MNSKIVLPLSLALNLFFMGGLLWRNRATPLPPASLPQDVLPSEATTEVAVPLPSRSTPTFHWSQIESTNYFTYVSGLRSIGCPEQTIRDIITADVRAALPALPVSQPGPVAMTSPNAGRSLGPRRQEQLINHILAAGTADILHASSLAENSPGQLPAVRQSTFAARPVIGNRFGAGTGTGGRVETGTIGEGAAASPHDPVATVKPVPSVAAIDNSPQPDSQDDSAPVTDPAPASATPEKKVWGNKSYWLADLIRARYGIESLLGWQQQAVREGITFDEFLQRHEFPVPSLPQIRSGLE